VLTPDVQRLALQVDRRNRASSVGHVAGRVQGERHAVRAATHDQQRDLWTGLALTPVVYVQLARRDIVNRKAAPVRNERV
jgi:hypothetical protein